MTARDPFAAKAAPPGIAPGATSPGRTARDTFDTLSPEFAVRINGEPWPNEARADMVELSVFDDVDAPGMLTITLAGWDALSMQPKWIDHPLFSLGAAIAIEFGYQDRRLTLLSGDITGLEPTFAQSRPPMVTVRGHDRRHRLTRSRRTRSFTNCKDSDIVSRIAGEVQLKPQVEDSGVQLPYVLQHNQTDLEFLIARARRIDFELAVQGDCLLFRRRAAGGTAELTLYREVELLEFRARLSTLGQVPALEVRGWDPARKDVIVGRASDAQAMGDDATTGPAATKQAFSPADAARVNAPVQSQDEADAMAKQGFAGMALDYVRADGVCIGEPRLHAGMVIAIEGIGKRFSGRWYVTSVEHAFTPRKGFRTSFSARRNAS